MGTGPIAPLSETELSFVPEPPEFEALAAAELGVHGTDADGFPALFNETADLTVAGSHAFDGTDEDIAAASSAAAAISIPEGAQLAAEIEPAATAADAELQNFLGDVPGGPIVTDPPTAPSDDTCNLTIDLGPFIPNADLGTVTFAVLPSDRIDFISGDTEIFLAALFTTNPPDEDNPNYSFQVSLRIATKNPGVEHARYALHQLNTETPYFICINMTVR